MARYSGAVVPGIASYLGWTLMQADEEDGDGFTTTSYFARGARSDVQLNHSRFSFDPTQERFDFLVRTGFPSWLGGIGPFSNADVDRAIRDEAVSISRVSEAQARFALRQSQHAAIGMILGSAA